MEQEEIKKEIEWLMGSIKRSYAYGKAEAIFMFIFFVLIAVIGILFSVFVYDGDSSSIPKEDASAGADLMILGGACILFISNFILRWKMARVETPQELLATHDRMWIIATVLWIAFIGSSFFFLQGTLLTKTCFVLGMVLLAISNWLAMNNKLSLSMGIIFILIEAVLLYFSNIDLLAGLFLLMMMVSIVQGKRTMFTGDGDSEGSIDEDTEQEIKQLRELVKKSKMAN